MNNIKKRFTKNLKNIVRISNKLRTFAHETKKPMNTYNFPFHFLLFYYLFYFFPPVLSMQGVSFLRLAAIVAKKEHWKWNVYHKNDVYLSYI